MRIGSVSGVYSRPKCMLMRQKKDDGTSAQPSDVNFRGKFGQIVGGVVGTGAVVAAAFMVAPAIICLTGAGLAGGAIAGHIVEDKTNKEGDYKKG